MLVTFIILIVPVRHPQGKSGVSWKTTHFLPLCMSGYVMVMQLMPIEIVAVISVLSSAVF
jgi:hypothetical protein